MTEKKIWQVCVAAVAGGMAILFYGLYVWINAEAQAKWPVAQAKIVSSRIVSAPNYSGDEDTSDSDSSEVEYSYVVAGQSFRASQHTDSRSLSDKHPQGAVASVHYDPTNPSSSILEPELIKGRSYTWIGFVICLLFPIAATVLSKQLNSGKQAGSRTLVQAPTGNAVTDF